MFALQKSTLVRIKPRMTDCFAICQETQYLTRTRDLCKERVNALLVQRLGDYRILQQQIERDDLQRRFVRSL